MNERTETMPDDLTALRAALDAAERENALLREELGQTRLLPADDTEVAALKLQLLSHLAEPEKLILEMKKGEHPAIEMEHWAVRDIVMSLAKSLRDAGAENFLVLDVHHHEMGKISVTLQLASPGKKTPSEVIGELREEIARLRRVADVAERYYSLWDCGNAVSDQLIELGRALADLHCRYPNTKETTP